MEYFIIGEPELVTGFALVGVEGKVALNRQDALEVFNRMTAQTSDKLISSKENRPKILIVTEEVAEFLQQEIFAWQMKGQSPLIVEIPGIHGHLAGRTSLTDAIREAVGISI